MSYIDIVKANLAIEEGERRMPYKDQFGNITIGIGRNLTGKGIREDEEELMFANDAAEAEQAARNIFSTFDALTDNRKAVVIDMAFNMGEAGLRGFHDTIASITSGDYDRAATDMLASRWASQIGQRAQKLSTMMRNG